MAFPSELDVDDPVVGEAPEVWPTTTAEEAPDAACVVVLLDTEPLFVALVTEVWVVVVVVAMVVGLGEETGGGVSVLK